MLKSKCINQVIPVFFVTLSIIVGSCNFQVNPVIEVTPEKSMFDQPVSVRILNCPGNEPVQIRATMFDDDSVKWVSESTFMHNKGIVDLTSDYPISGSYETADAMGFIWSMRAEDKKTPTLFSSKECTPLHIQLDVFIHDSVIVSRNISRQRVNSDIRRIDVRDDSLVGTLFIPETADKVPGVIMLTGSGGGISESPAAILASHGYITFALAYFGMESLPETLTNIPLEYFGKAIRYLQRLEGIDPNRIAVTGRSRGGELSLLIGATYHEIRCVIAYVPSIFCNPGAEGPAWTLKGEPLPFISRMPDRQILTDIEKDMAAGKAVSFTPMFESLIHDPDLISDTEIPVEKINGPILLISGQDDQLWPSTKFSEIAVKRLDSKSFKHEVIHLSYPNAGHLIGRPFRPTTVSEGVHPVNGILLNLGGTPTGNALASEDSWQHFLTFLENSFSQK